MIRWCSYCQCYMGESSPYDSFKFTHGICDSCKEEVQEGALTSEINEQIKKTQKLYDEMRSDPDRPPADIREFVQQARSLEIEPGDLLMGLIQPRLYEIGQLHVEGKMSVAQEHLFSQFSEKLLNFIEIEYGFEEVRDPEVILFCANGNYHSLGVRILSVILRSRGMKVATYTPSIPVEEAVEIVEKFRPKLVGVSISMESQLSFVKSLSEQTEETRIFVGGSLLKDSRYREELNAEFVSTLYGFQEIIHAFEKALRGEQAA